MTGDLVDSSLTPPVALTIAGTDSGGGAGIAADLHTFRAFGVFGTLVVTAVTAQNTEKVHEVCAQELPIVDAQIDAVLADFPVASVKTGMLATVDIIELVVARAAKGDLPQLVVDPVLVSTSGSALFHGDAQSAYRSLLQYADVLTPNLAEASVLCGREIDDISHMIDAAKELADLGARHVVVKGGHLGGKSSVDVYYDGSEVTMLESPRLTTTNDHGTGCTLSAAIAANLAKQIAAPIAVDLAKRHVNAALAASANWRLGIGPGPVSPFTQF